MDIPDLDPNRYRVTHATAGQNKVATTLVVTGFRHPPSIPATRFKTQHNRQYGYFRFQFHLPLGITVDDLKHTYEHGVLVISLRTD